MRQLLPFAIPLVGLLIDTILILWEMARAGSKPMEPLYLNFRGDIDETNIEGRVRLHIWAAKWSGGLPEIVLESIGASATARKIIQLLIRLYPSAFREDFPLHEGTN